MEGSPISVVAGAVLEVSASPKVLLAKRHTAGHQGGKWEFPGGKIERGESVFEALARELREEVGIEVQESQPLIRFPFEYPEFHMDFEVFRVMAWRGEPRALAAQEIRWVDVGELHTYKTPPASRAVIRALQLPQKYAISADPAADKDAWFAALDATLEQDTRFIQLRAHDLPSDEFPEFAARAIQRVHAAGGKILLNTEVEQAVQLGADGAHLTASMLLRWGRSALPEDFVVGASCHSVSELHEAQERGVDFAVLSPVQEGSGDKVLGFSGFEQTIAEIALPVYALGGMQSSDLPQAIAAGAQGIAAIRGLWGTTN